MWGTLLNVLKTALYSPFTWVIGNFFPKAFLVLRSILANGLNIAGWLVLLEELGKKILGVFGLVGAFGSGSATIAQIYHLLGSIGDPQAALLDYLSSVISMGPYSLDALVANADSVLASMTSGSFHPAVTLTYLLQVTAVGECFNQLLQSVIQNAVFVFSVFLVRWAFRQNFTFTKSVPGS